MSNCPGPELQQPPAPKIPLAQACLLTDTTSACTFVAAEWSPWPHHLCMCPPNQEHSWKRGGYTRRMDKLGCGLLCSQSYVCASAYSHIRADWYTHCSEYDHVRVIACAAMRGYNYASACVYSMRVPICVLCGCMVCACVCKNVCVCVCTCRTIRAYVFVDVRMHVCVCLAANACERVWLNVHACKCVTMLEHGRVTTHSQDCVGHG